VVLFIAWLKLKSSSLYAQLPNEIVLERVTKVGLVEALPVPPYIVEPARTAEFKVCVPFHQISNPDR
jgi:hypothetical protein